MNFCTTPRSTQGQQRILRDGSPSKALPQAQLHESCATKSTAWKTSSTKSRAMSMSCEKTPRTHAAGLDVHSILMTASFQLSICSRKLWTAWSETPQHANHSSS